MGYDTISADARLALIRRVNRGEEPEDCEFLLQQLDLVKADLFFIRAELAKRTDADSEGGRKLSAPNNEMPKPGEVWKWVTVPPGAERDIVGCTICIDCYGDHYRSLPLGIIGCYSLATVQKHAKRIA